MMDCDDLRNGSRNGRYYRRRGYCDGC